MNKTNRLSATTGSRFLGLLFVLVLPLLLILLYSCADEEEQYLRGIKSQEIQFSVNKTLVGEEYTNDTLGFRMAPPKGWEIVPEQMKQELYDRLQNQGLESLGGIDPREIFLNKKTGSTLIIYTDDKPLTEKIKSFSPKDEEVIRFENNGITFYQIRKIAEKSVNFILFFKPEEKPSVGIFYFIGKQFYQDEIKKLESSIGSIELLQ